MAYIAKGFEHYPSIELLKDVICEFRFRDDELEHLDICSALLSELEARLPSSYATDCNIHSQEKYDGP
ncbi:hypothetical protein DENSPDRAFT_832227 [Dentipellis sp. KUC8613]|nr:hypothetical protein DENSPDRAFT_832227 [Dentipellis sp. KUC8613]